ncbi:hypothetical protein UFB30_09095 [Jeotgalibacillus sp. HH7-29]|uniref:Uncharacterized protein n=1 Tax=Jeotgalibacillus haloalkalitolerans TaxID=3104292 RepID=A0ABU5KM95_9BACL|nr:hypothetical protein [Jeotgalibacillus sp. HH7-29]
MPRKALLHRKELPLTVVTGSFRKRFKGATTIKYLYQVCDNSRFISV